VAFHRSLRPSQPADSRDHSGGQGAKVQPQRERAHRIAGVKDYVAVFAVYNAPEEAIDHVWLPTVPLYRQDKTQEDGHARGNRHAKREPFNTRKQASRPQHD